MMRGSRTDSHNPLVTRESGFRPASDGYCRQPLSGAASYHNSQMQVNHDSVATAKTKSVNNIAGHTRPVESQDHGHNMDIYSRSLQC